ncbi:MAG TPA: helix-turn-helix domain-containing protein [Gemmatimonadales bacterium]|jgi:AcrR family transcriptional regulator
MARPPGTAHPLLLDAAERLLLRHGYRRVTVEDLAREAGIGKGSVYLHFDSKEEVALAVVNRWSDRVFDRLRTLAAEPLPADRRLLRMLEARVLGRYDQLGSAPESLHEMFAAIRPALLIQRERLLETESRIFAGVLRELRSSARASEPLIRRTADALLIGTNWLLPYYMDPSQQGGRAEVKRRTRQVALLLVAGATQLLGSRRAAR